MAFNRSSQRQNVAIILSSMSFLLWGVKWVFPLNLEEEAHGFNKWQLGLSYNKIQELPRWIGELSALRVIGLSGNYLRTLPSEIGSLRELRHLHLSRNRLEALPEALRTLPLVALLLEANPALGLPDSILNRPAEEILRYYFESRDEKGHQLLELKLLLVGRGGAGKTTLVKRLAGEEPDAYELETHSIAIRELALVCPRGQVRTRAWDFGGQEILHATH